MAIIADGPIRGIVAVSTGLGEVRGYVGSPMLGEMKLTEAVGLGNVQIVKNDPDWPRPYNGITAIRNGDIDRDIGKWSSITSCLFFFSARTNLRSIRCIFGRK